MSSSLKSANAPSEVSGNTATAPEGLQSFQVKQTSQTAVKPHKPLGRPSEFEESIFHEICERIAIGETLLGICEDERMPARQTFLRWMRKSEDLRNIYARAREDQQHAWADQIVQIADDGRNDTMTVERGGEVIEVKDRDWIERSKLRVETRLRLMAKLLPKVYGDKLEQTITGNMTTSFTLNIGDGSVRDRQPKNVAGEPKRLTIDLKPKPAQEIIDENL